MTDPTIPAEVSPVPGQTRAAALELQRLGFRVLHIGGTISVQAPEGVWTKVFGLSFTRERRSRIPGMAGSEVEYSVPDPDPAPIPAGLAALVVSVDFARPPELY